ncbi:YfiT family bacillithiol transferase [Flavobacterium procerum]|uniref:YfiT family bacillithiol transferase n=1 Tax=Flavobacterium procerum TaxID=1455569 RepID=A0ABV6BJV1_9FLAO
MTELDLEKLKYPIGKFIAPENYSIVYIEEKINEIETLPNRLEKEVLHLTDEQLDTPYRPDGWTVRQVVHHCAESHMNCFIRIKWALTENNPVIKAYDEVLWAELPDDLKMPIEPTLNLLKGLHARLAFIMKNLTESDLEKTFIHPSDNSENKIKKIIGSYAWHGNHHLAHITTLKKYKNWQ